MTMPHIVLSNKIESKPTISEGKKEKKAKIGKTKTKFAQSSEGFERSSRSNSVSNLESALWLTSKKPTRSQLDLLLELRRWER